MDPTLSFGAIGALFASAAFFVGVLTAGITFAWPLRPSWLPWLVSMIIGPLITFGLAKANGLMLTESMYYQCLFVGLMAGASAGGYSQMTRKGDEIRSEQQKQAYGTVEKPAETPPVPPANPNPPGPETPPVPPANRFAPPPIGSTGAYRTAQARHGSSGPAIFEGVDHGIKATYDGPDRRELDPRDTYRGRERRKSMRAPENMIRRRPTEETPE